MIEYNAAGMESPKRMAERRRAAEYYRTPEHEEQVREAETTLDTSLQEIRPRLTPEKFAEYGAQTRQEILALGTKMQERAVKRFPLLKGTFLASIGVNAFSAGGNFAIGNLPTAFVSLSLICSSIFFLLEINEREQGKKNKNGKKH